MSTLSELVQVYQDHESVIEEVDFWHLAPEIHQMHKDQYEGSPECRYCSDRIMLVGPHMGVVTSYVRDLLKELDSCLKDFRHRY